MADTLPSFCREPGACQIFLIGIYACRDAGCE